MSARLVDLVDEDLSIWPKCGSEARVIACSEDQTAIDKILNHLQTRGALLPPPELPPVKRASPQADWFA